MNAPLPPLIAALRAQLRAELVDTHISWVLLAGDQAWKIKKPVTLPFLDYGSVERRRACCAAEVALNQRYAADLYLGVMPIGGTPDSPRLGAEPAIEWAVHMRRFNEAARLDHVCARGELTEAQVETLATVIADFHARAAAATPDSRFGTPAQALAPALENFAELNQLLPEHRPRLAALELWTHAEHTRRAPTLAARKAAVRIRECHGDLHLGNLALIDGRIVPFDCIEFNDALRWIDCASEIAFTYLDLLDHGRADLAGLFLDAWLTATGDFGALPVLRFYAVYRALVRAKVAALRGNEAGRSEAAAYIDFAERLAGPPAPTLAITFGLSGSGKSTAARARLMRDPAAATVRLRSDVERKRLFGLAAHDASGSALDAGIYTAEATARTYARLHELAAEALAAGWSVVVDAAFLRRDERRAFAALARQKGVPFAIVACTAPRAELLRRLDTRQGDASEATAAVLEKQFDWIEPLAEDEQACALGA